MQYQDAEKLLKDLEKDIYNSNIGDRLKLLLYGMIKCINQYLSQIYKRLPAKIDDL